MTAHTICDACECVSHCSKNGCIPLTPLPAAPIFRAPSVGCSGETTSELLKDLRWRVNDVRETLMESFGDQRIYGCDEWSTPVVNLQRAIDKIDRAITAQGATA